MAARQELTIVSPGFPLTDLLCSDLEPEFDASGFEYHADDSVSLYACEIQTEVSALDRDLACGMATACLGVRPVGIERPATFAD
jgi:hypothetical protein